VTREAEKVAKSYYRLIGGIYSLSGKIHILASHTGVDFNQDVNKLKQLAEITEKLISSANNLPKDEVIEGDNILSVQEVMEK